METEAQAQNQKSRFSLVEWVSSLIYDLAVVAIVEHSSEILKFLLHLVKYFTK